MTLMACFPCDLLYEVADAPAAAGPRCLRCGGALRAHTPQEIFDLSDDDLTRPVAAPRGADDLTRPQRAHDFGGAELDGDGFEADDTRVVGGLRDIVKRLHAQPAPDRAVVSAEAVRAAFGRRTPTRVVDATPSDDPLPDPGPTRIEGDAGFDNEAPTRVGAEPTAPEVVTKVAAAGRADDDAEMPTAIAVVALPADAEDDRPKGIAAVGQGALAEDEMPTGIAAVGPGALAEDEMPTGIAAVGPAALAEDEMPTAFAAVGAAGAHGGRRALAASRPPPVADDLDDDLPTRRARVRPAEQPDRAARGRPAQVREDDTRPRPAVSRPPPPSAADATPGPTRVALGGGASARPRALTPPPTGQRSSPTPGQRPPPIAPGQRPPPPAPGQRPPPPAPDAAPLEADYQAGPYASWFDARPSRVAEPTDAIAGIIQQEKGRDRGTRITPRMGGGRRRGGWRLLLGAGLLALLAVGALGLVWWQRDAPTGRRPAAAPADPEPPAASPLEQGLVETQARLPVAVAADPVDATTYLVAGPEGVRSTAGPVPGLTTARVPDTLVTVDEQGAWIPGLVEALTRAVDSPRLLTLALDAGTDARSVARFARSGRRAGFDRFALVVQPPGATGARGSLEFEVPGPARPSAGIAVVRVGRLGVHASVEGRDGRKLDEGDMVPRRGGRLDREGLDRLLTRLTGAHPLVRVALLHANGDLPLPELVDVISVLRTAGDQDRYPTVWLAVH